MFPITERYGVDLFSLFSHLDEGVILVDADDHIRWISPPGIAMLGETIEKLLDRHIDQLFIEGSEINFLDETLMEIRLPDASGKQMYITFKDVPLPSREGGNWKAFVFRDISLMRDLEEELKRQRRSVDIATKNSKMKEILDLMLNVASSNATVLIQGESGTGKELIANAIHQHSSRNNRPLITINCSALPETLLESELFGHAKGSFTGAFTDKKGRFEIADGGTIFLDEIGELSLHLQVKLLRVLQERCFERLGSNKTINVDIRIIAATNRNLRHEVEKGNFRADFYYRLNVVPVLLPPLRERMEDIPLLINHFLREFSAKGYKSVKGVSSEVMDIFMRYHWPGNIRELENAIEHALVCSREEIIKLEDIPSDIRGEAGIDNQPPPMAAMMSSTPPTSISPSHYSDTLPGGRKPYRMVSLDDCRRALTACGGNKSMAARHLGIHRTTLHKKLAAANK